MRVLLDITLIVRPCSRLGPNEPNVAKEINIAISFRIGAWSLCRKINELKVRQGSSEFIDLDAAKS